MSPFSRDLSTFKGRAHRTLADAFPDERAYAVQHYRRQRIGLLWRAAVLVACCVFIGWGFAEGLTS